AFLRMPFRNENAHVLSAIAGGLEASGHARCRQRAVSRRKSGVRLNQFLVGLAKSGASLIVVLRKSRFPDNENEQACRESAIHLRPNFLLVPPPSGATTRIRQTALPRQA